MAEPTYTLQDALLLLSQLAQAASPTEAQRGYQRGIEDIFDPKVLAIADPLSAQPKLPKVYTEDELIDIYAPDLRLYGTSDPDSLEAGIFADILGRKNLADINKSIRANYSAELERLQKLNPDLALADTPTLEDYLAIGKELYRDYGTVRSKQKEQELAFKEAEEKGNIFKQSGYPEITAQYNPREFFADQYKAAEEEISKRIKAVPQLSKFDPVAFAATAKPAVPVPAAIAKQQGRTTTPTPSRTAEASSDALASAQAFREQVLNELDKIATKKIQESGRSPFLDKAVRALSVGR